MGNNVPKQLTYEVSYIRDTLVMSVQIGGISRYSHTFFLSKNGKVHMDSKSKKIDAQIYFLQVFSKCAPEEFCSEAACEVRIQNCIVAR